MATLQLTERLDWHGEPDGVLGLPFDVRQKSRFRATLEDGRDVAVVLPRGGGTLCDGELLSGPGGEVVRVRAAPEPVSTVRASDAVTLARAAYHLGNRHVPLQVGHGWLRYRGDHVLDNMLRRLGLTVTADQAPFQPEPGAYGQHAHRHAHEHG